ncbi:MAG: cyclomaltodextrinase N-terminal domain-containing protein [Marinilabiliales bacterium]|nr:cyclomaltodextrinase N-terminal domain-containing protein [Marinilabiliales bacterium]
MKESALQLMVYGQGIGAYEVKTDYPGVAVTTMVRTENPNYLFVNLEITREARPGTVKLTFTSGKKQLTHDYPLYERPAGPARGFNSSDVIYLLMPDRFANGDPSNDNLEGMTEKLNRSNPGGRHGGDLKGINDNLDYLQKPGSDWHLAESLP